MRIKLLCDVSGEKHGLTKGRVLEVSGTNEGGMRGHVRWWVWGDAGQEVGIFVNEAEEVSDE